jgi:hypothetical protein
MMAATIPPNDVSKVSVVIPTYGGGEHLPTTLCRVVSSDTSSLDNLEVIVVDDGSPQPVAPLVQEYGRRTPIRLSTIRQPNAGPAAARNSGFRAATGDLVLFLDDDVEIPRDLIISHVAAHQRCPRSVVWGRCVLPPGSAVVRDVLVGLGADGVEAAPEFVRVSHLASGQLSVERSQFEGRGSVYADDLRTPAAEEYELAHRLHREGVPVFFASRILAVHHQSIEIAALCHQQYKHGLGCAEVVCKRPATREWTDLARIIERCASRPTTPGGLAKLLASSWPMRRGLLAAAKRLESRGASPTLVRALCRSAIAAHFVAGVRDGLREYGF